jgi:type I restriction enzyme S subunit
MKLAPYPEYKDSGAPWLGKIPAHWESRKLRNMLTPVSDRNRPDLPLLSVVREKGVIKRNVSSKEENHNFIPDDLSNYKVVLKGQFAMNKMKAWQGSYGVSNLDGIVSPAYFVFDLDGAEGKFFHVAIRSKTYVPFFTQASDGVRVGQWDLNQSRMKEIPFFIPSAEEQTQIACFLGWKTAQINKFIRNKRRLIELLKEQKQNVINQAVTRGLDPKVKFKPSGVEWIGDIPEHWDATKLKRVVSFNPSKSETRANPADEEKVVFLPMENISVNGDIDCSEKRALSEVWNGFTYFRRGDVVVAKITPCFENGKGAYLKGLESDFGFGTTELIVLRPSKAIDGAFLRFLTSTKQFLLLGEQYMTGAAGQQRIPSDFVKNYPIGLPPIDEQLEILEHIQEKSAEIDQAISRAQREIELMREYRTRLISDVVTGQVDVRGIEVPEVAEDELLALDEDSSEADDVIDDEGDMDETD